MAENIVVPIALFFLDRVLSSLDQILPQCNVRQEAKDIKNSLRTMKAYLWDVEGNQGSEVLKDRVKQVRAIAYETEDVLDEFILNVTVRFHSHIISKKAHEFVHTLTNWIPLLETSSKIKEIKRKIAEIAALDSLRGGGRGLTVSGEGPSSSSRAEHPLTFPHVGDGCEIVGFEKPTNKLIRQLDGAERTQKTISLVGPCGSGKSMLAKNVYNNTRGQRRFDCYAWVHVSQSPKLDYILSSLLKQFCASMNQEPIPHEKEDTRAKLGNYLQQKSYVVFLDDIWSKKDWEYIQNALPNGSNRSRTVITTRNSDVASFCSESSDIHYLEGLSYQEAWQLFCTKAFRASKCPRELEDWSQKIVKRCEGNPMAIVAVGTLLSKKQQIPTEWKRMHDNLVSEIGTDSSLSIIDKLLTSYKDLPWYLKTCFLYFSLFPEDYSLERGRLVRLWMAEGFVSKTTGSKMLELEEVAEDYLKELVGRGLVHVNRRDFDGRVRDCRVLNFVLEFIVQKSEEENFVSVHLAEADTSSTEKPRRLSINTIAGSGTKSPLSRGDLSSVRSTFYFKNKELSDPSVIRVIL